MALEGTLEDFSLADIFQLIGIQRKSGILTLKNPEETITVKFYNGMVVGADSSAKKIEDRLGKVLVKTGLVSPDELRAALTHQKKTLQKIGYILVDKKYISKDQLREALQIQTAQLLYKLFRWHSGEYYFDQKAKIDPESEENIIPMSAESILLEGIQMIDEWPLIQKRIPSYDIVFRPVVQLEDLVLAEDEEDIDTELSEIFANPKGSPAPEDPDLNGKVRLSKEEAEVFRLLDGKNTVNDVIECSKHGEFHTCKAIYDLLERKIIAPIALIAPALKEKASPRLSKGKTKKSSSLLYLALAAAVITLSIWNGSDPLRIFKWKFIEPKSSEDLKTSIHATQLNLVDSAILMYFYVNGLLPQRLEDLVEKNYLRPADIVDASSRSYSYDVQGNSYVLAALGVDGRPDDRLLVRRSVNAVRVPPPKIRQVKP